MRRSIAVSAVWSMIAAVALTAVCCLLAHPILYWMQTPDRIYDMAYEYMFAVLLGTGATVFYNMIFQHSPGALETVKRRCISWSFPHC